jgi:anti-sigma B factor antagonist
MQAVGAALDEGGRVVLDLAAMTFIDSQGLKLLMQAYRANTSGRAGRVVLRSPQAHARKALEITGLDKLLTIED